MCLALRNVGVNALVFQVFFFSIIINAYLPLHAVDFELYSKLIHKRVLLASEGQSVLGINSCLNFGNNKDDRKSTATEREPERGQREIEPERERKREKEREKDKKKENEKEELRVGANKAFGCNIVELGLAEVVATTNCSLFFNRNMVWQSARLVL